MREAGIVSTWKTGQGRTIPNIQKRELSKSTTELDTSTETLLNSVYSELLGMWQLTQAHETYLLSRGFTTEQIKRQRYSTSKNDKILIELLSKKFGPDLLKVPGFEQATNGIKFRSSGKLIIPTINVYGNVINLRSRIEYLNNDGAIEKKYFYISSNDDKNPNGLKAYTAAHVIIPNKVEDETVWITEGEFKAHVASDKLNVRFISIPGVSSWRLALPTLEKMRARKVIIAFDKDLWDVPPVALNLIKLFNQLKGENYETAIAQW